MVPQEIVIPVKVQVWPMMLVVLFFGAGAYFLLPAALAAEPHDASEMWAGFAICAGFAVIAAGALSVGLLSKEKLVLGAEDIQLPRALFARKVTRIRYADITTMDAVKVGGQRMISIGTRRKSHAIAAMLLPRSVPLGEVKEQITRRVAIARGIPVR